MFNTMAEVFEKDHPHNFFEAVKLHLDLRNWSIYRQLNRTEWEAGCYRHSISAVMTEEQNIAF